jgi:arylsulfatase A-like enzyme
MNCPGRFSRRSFLAASSAAAGALALPRVLGAPATAAARPNLVFILMDDLGWADLGCYGSTFHQTPNLDRLAGQGMRFTDGYAACPVCSPTRASLLTGKYPARLGVTNFLVGSRWPDDSPIAPVDWQTKGVPESETTLAELLRSAGYATAHVGKWHVGADPKAQGFDTVVPQLPRGHFAKDNQYESDYYAREVSRILAANKSQPFYLQVWPFLVHIPLQAKQELIRKYEAKLKAGRPTPQDNPVYAAMVESSDDLVGRILSKLDELGLADNTVVVFSSDNGGLSVDEGGNRRPTSNAPLRDGKGYLYEGGVREPWIVRWPGVVKAGATCSTPITSVDFLPTVMEMAGLASKTPDRLDGQSFVGLLKQLAGPSRDAIYWHYPHYSNQGGKPGGAVRAGDLKLIQWYEEGDVELYDLKADPGEKTNLAATHADKAAQLLGMLDGWRKSVGAQMPRRRGG